MRWWVGVAAPGSSSPACGKSQGSSQSGVPESTHPFLQSCSQVLAVPGLGSAAHRVASTSSDKGAQRAPVLYVGTECISVLLLTPARASARALSSSTATGC